MNKLFSLLAAFSLTAAVLSPTVLTTGCVTTSTVAEGSDPVVVNLEQTYKTAFALADGFLEWEFHNRSVLPEDVQKFAAQVRRDFPPAYDAFKALVRSYKANPATTDMVALQRAKQVLETLITQIRLLVPAQVETNATKAATKMKD